MLELPESLVFSQQLSETLTGKIIRNVEAAASPHGFAFYTGDPASYHDKLSGRAVTGSRPNGGQVVLQAGEMRLIFADGANLRFLAPGKPLPKKHQLLLEFEDESHLVVTVQMYAGLHLIGQDEDPGPYYQVARDKPSPYTKEFTRDYFLSLRQGCKDTMSAKAFLATEQRIPGLGNGVLQDLLLLSGIHPKSHIGTLRPEQWDKLYRVLVDTLVQMASRGGRDTEKDLFGTPGGYKTLLSKKTLSAPCPSCGGELTRQAYLGGNVYFCPACQPVQK